MAKRTAPPQRCSPCCSRCATRTPRDFGIRRALRTYLEALGFADFVDDGVRSVPAPESFSRLLTQRGHASAGLRPWLDAKSSWDEPVIVDRALAAASERKPLITSERARRWRH